MPTLMPSLFKYFLTIGALLFVGLIGLNAVMEPGGGPGLRRVQDSQKAKLVRHDPRASLVERLREEEAAQRASGKAEASPFQQPAVPAAPAARPRTAVTQAAAVAEPQPTKFATVEPAAPAATEPSPATATEPLSAPASLSGVPTEEEARATRVA